MLQPHALVYSETATNDPTFNTYLQHGHNIFLKIILFLLMH